MLTINPKSPACPCSSGRRTAGRQILNSLVKILSTFFGAGYLPFMPGTFASIIGIFLYYLIRGNSVTYLSLTLALMISGFLVSGRAEELFGKKDACCIVIDEIVGVLLCFMFIPYDIKLVIIAFILFRILDALKPFPAARLEEQYGSVGIMTDDIVAGLYTNLILQVALRLASFKIS